MAATLTSCHSLRHAVPLSCVLQWRRWGDRLSSMGRLSRWSPSLLVCAVAATVFALGCDWGLPSAAVDGYLFGSKRAVWSGKTIAELAPRRREDASRGADVASGTRLDRSAAQDINSTDSQRASIIRRFRLFTYQPDEMITLMALATMSGNGRADPQMYQYGGLWIYPVGALLKSACKAGVIESGDMTRFLDHPEAIGGFYVITRLYTAAWGVVGAWAVYWIGRRLTGRRFAGVVVGLCYVFMPAVITTAHEAKPHLSGAALSLLAIAAAMQYTRRRGMAWLLTAGALCGGALGMVLSAWPVFAVLPMALLLQGRTRREMVSRCGAAFVVGVGVYFVTNPYVAIHLLASRAVLASNLSNNAMFHLIGGENIANAWGCIWEGTGPVICVAGILGWIGLLLAGKLNTPSIGQAAKGRWWILLAPAVVAAAQFVVMAGGRPAEYGRFALLPDIALALGAVCGMAMIQASTSAFIPYVLLVTLTVVFGVRYEEAFHADCPGAISSSSRMSAAAFIQKKATEANDSISIEIPAEPAPYDMPPLNLFDTRLILLPEAKPGTAIRLSADMVVAVAEKAPFPVGRQADYDWYWFRGNNAGTDMSWAAKTFVVGVRKAAR